MNDWKAQQAARRGQSLLNPSHTWSADDWSAAVRRMLSRRTWALDKTPAAPVDVAEEVAS